MKASIMNVEEKLEVSEWRKYCRYMFQELCNKEGRQCHSKEELRALGSP